MALARAESLSGNTVGAENYYQHAEHYYREMSSDPEARSEVFSSDRICPGAGEDPV